MLKGKKQGYCMYMCGLSNVTGFLHITSLCRKHFYLLTRICC